MMYFRICNDLRLSSYNQSIILLDLRKNEYAILPDDVSSQLRKLLTTKFIYHSTDGYVPKNKNINLSEEEKELIKYFREMKYFDDDLSPNASNVDLVAVKKSGAPNIDWKIRDHKINYKYSKLEFCNAYFMLIKICFISYFFAFKCLINTTNLKKHKKEYISPSIYEENRLAAVLNAACFYFPFRIKCLEWSVAYVNLAHKRNWKCNLEIGVQNIPFMAHAWARTENGPVADDPDLPNSLSVILTEPFNNKEL